MQALGSATCQCFVEVRWALMFIFGEVLEFSNTCGSKRLLRDQMRAKSIARVSIRTMTTQPFLLKNHCQCIFGLTRMPVLTPRATKTLLACMIIQTIWVEAKTATQACCRHHQQETKQTCNNKCTVDVSHYCMLDISSRTATLYPNWMKPLQNYILRLKSCLF